MLDNMDFSSLSLEGTHYQLLGVFQIQSDVFSTPENSQCWNHPNLHCENGSEATGSLDIVQ